MSTRQAQYWRFMEQAFQQAKEADWEKRDRKENVVPTDSRSWYGWKRQMEKRRNDNECNWISEYVSLRLQR